MLKQGTWNLSSESDPRWNCSGRGLVGMFTMPNEMLEAIERLKKELGVPPEDLAWSYAKD